MHDVGEPAAPSQPLQRAQAQAESLHQPSGSPAFFLQTPAGAQSTLEAAPRCPDASRSHQQPGPGPRQRLPSAKGTIEGPDPAGPEVGGQAGGRTPDIPWGSRQPRSSRSRAGREQAGQEHSGLLATRAEETAAASPVQAVGLQLQRRGARSRPRSMSASRPW